MEVVILPTHKAIASLVADSVETLLRRRPFAALGLATGSSPLALYAELKRRYDEQGLSFAHARGYILDEYVGLPPEHPQSYGAVIRRQFTDRVDFAAGAVQGPDGNASDLVTECARFERSIADAGGIDVQILGLGTDGHIAFNEPGSSLASRTRIKTLTETTRMDNARFFSTLDEVPHHVLTQGLGTILEARHLALIASGEEKSAAVAALVEGPVSSYCPASVLQLHRHVTVLLDTSAAARLKNIDYYRQAFEGKPSWQSI